jgi:hypothetical protein
MWTAHDAATPSTPAVIEGAGEPVDPDLSMLDSVVMERDHTYQPPAPVETASAGDGQDDNGEAAAS